MPIEDPEIRRLRAEINKRYRDVSKKISRLKRVNGVDIGSTKYDPRRDISKVKRYNKAQLESHLGQLNSFQSRRTGFQQGAENTILPTAKVREYRALERKNNRRVGRYESMTANQFLQNSGMTVAGKRAMKNKDLPFAGAEASNRPFVESNRKMSNVRGEAALDQMINKMKKKVTREFSAKEIREQRKQYNKMAKAIGVRGLQKSARELNDYQWNMFWTEEGMAESMGQAYFQVTSTSESIQKNKKGIFDANITEVKEALANAAKLETPKGWTALVEPRRPVSRRRPR